MSLQAYAIANIASQQVANSSSATAVPVWIQPGPWTRSTALQIRQLQKLQPNWDSYGAEPVSRRAVDLMIEVLAGVMNSNTPAPALVPSPQGHLQAEWHLNGIDLEVEAVDPTHILVDYEGPDGSWSEVLSVNFEKLVRAVNRLSTP